jgi:hypothetical protein
MKEVRFQLLIVGDGKHKAKLTQLSQELGIRNQCIFTGYIDPRHLARCTDGFDFRHRLEIKRSAWSDWKLRPAVYHSGIQGCPILGVSIMGRWIHRAGEMSCSSNFNFER